MQNIVIRHQFNQVEILSCEYNGVPVVLAHQVGQALGYKDPSRVAENIARRWSEDLIEGQDYFRLGAEETSALRDATRDLRVASKTNNITILTLSGADMVAMLSRTPVARTFRRWLVDEVLPAYRAGHAPEVSEAHIAGIAGAVCRTILAEILTGRASAPGPTGPVVAPDAYSCAEDIARNTGAKKKDIQSATRALRKEYRMFGYKYPSRYGSERPAYYYSPAETALVVATLRAVGAIKASGTSTLDMFGTGDPEN